MAVPRREGLGRIGELECERDAPAREAVGVTTGAVRERVEVALALFFTGDWERECVGETVRELVTVNGLEDEVGQREGVRVPVMVEDTEGD